MAWTYSGNPASSPLDAVRFEVQDTDEKAQLLTDAEVEFAIAKEAPGKTPSQGALLGAAAHCLEALARRFAAQADTQVGTLQTTYSKSAEVFAARAKELRKRALDMRGAPWAGGQSESEKEARQNEGDRVQPAFARRQFNAPIQGGSVVPLVGPGEGA